MKKAKEYLKMLGEDVSSFTLTPENEMANLLRDLLQHIGRLKTKDQIWDIVKKHKIGDRKIRYIQNYLQMNQLSLFLSYRTYLNQLYYEMTKNKQIPDLIEFDHNDQASNYQSLVKYIQRLFQEFADRIISKGLNENAKIINSILRTL